MRDVARTNSICPPPETVLLESVRKNETETIKTLIKTNPSLLTYKYPYNSKTILLKACSENGVDKPTIQTLIDLGGNLEGNAKWKPLHLAAENLNILILDVIIKNLQKNSEKINDTIEGNTALHTLIKGNKIAEDEEKFCRNVELLLKAGIDVNRGDSKNLSAIFWAAKNGYKSIIKTILNTCQDMSCHVDLDSHKLENKSARDLIKEKHLYNASLPERLTYQNTKDKIFSLIKLAEEDKFIEYFDTYFSDDVNLDDGTSTFLQYSCKSGLIKVAKHLIERGADIDKTVQKCDQTALEIVIEKGYYEILKILLDQPDPKISPTIFCYLIKHLDNPKFEKIDHEKCCQLILKKLESHSIKMDINGEDHMKNTPIYYSLRFADEATTQRLLLLGASLACKNKFGVMPIEDIKPEMLERHLNDCVKFNIKNKNDEKRGFEVVFDYKSLIPPRHCEKSGRDNSDSENSRSDNVAPETEVIAHMSKAPEFRAFLQHPVIVSFLFMKWHRIRFLFYINLLFYALFVASLIAYIFTYYANFDFRKDYNFSTSLSKLSWVFLNLTFCILIFREMFQITVSPSKYLKNFENLVEIVLIVITGMILYIESPTSDTRKQLASVAILLAAFELVLMVGQHPKLSTNVVMLKTVSVNFFKLLLWCSLLIIAFALSFYILFAKQESMQNMNGTETEKKDLFMGPGKSLFKTIIMLTGEFDAGSINFDTNPITSKLIFSLFVFMITIILINLLNGLAVSDIQTIKNNAELVGHIARAQHIYYVESMLLGNILPTSLVQIIQSLFCCCPCDKNKTFKFFKPLGRRVCLFTSTEFCQLFVLPNNNGKIYFEPNAFSKSLLNCSTTCSDTYLDNHTVESIINIVKVRR